MQSELVVEDVIRERSMKVGGQLCGSELPPPPSPPISLTGVQREVLESLQTSRCIATLIKR